MVRKRRKRRCLSKGAKVVIQESWHSDVVPGMPATMVRSMRGGYAVEITTTYSDALGKRRLETRCLYFARGAIAPER